MTDPIIRFDKVVKRYGSLVVINELDFAVAPGEKVTIIGPSGSGKSTVLRILMTLEKIQGGLITVAGEPLWHEQKNGALQPASDAHLRKMRRTLGMVFQQFNLFPHMTALRNVSEAPRQVLGLSRQDARERAMATRWRWPPESLPGISSALPAMPTRLSSASPRSRACAAPMPRSLVRPSVILPSAERCGNRLKAWNTKPTRWRSRLISVLRAPTSMPSTRTWP